MSVINLDENFIDENKKCGLQPHIKPGIHSKPKCKPKKDCGECNLNLYTEPGVDRSVEPVEGQGKIICGILNTYPRIHKKCDIVFNSNKGSKIQQVRCLSRQEFLLRLNVNNNYGTKLEFVFTNSDTLKIPYFLGCFSKSLPHDKLARPNPEAISKLIDSVFVNVNDIDNIPYGGTLRLVSPSSIYSLDLIGPYKSEIPVPLPSSISSAKYAALIVELYAMALLRDVPFSQYNTDSQVRLVVADLNNTRCFTGPRDNCFVTPDTLFRGNSKGDLIGPYTSQFLYLSFKYGVIDIEQKFTQNAPGVDFMITSTTALSVQNGTVTEKFAPIIAKRFIATLRDGATYVHTDEPPEAFINAYLVLLRLGVPFARGVPPRTNNHESFSIDYGRVDLWDLLNRCQRIAMLSAWYQKYNFLAIRPEAFGIEIQKKKTGFSDIHISKNILDSEILERSFAKFGTYLLPQAYPEGSPVHPSYPAGHGVIAGALSTILKAYYDENFTIDAFEPSLDGSQLLPLGYQVRVGDELNKLASNIAFFRNAAGIHTREDAIAGILLGENIAIEMLRDHVLRYPLKTIFRFHRYGGELVEISN